MSHTEDRDSLDESAESLEHSVFRGLTPRPAHFDSPETTPAAGLRKGLYSSIPLLMTGSLATGVIATPGLAHVVPGNTHDSRGQATESDARPTLSDRLQSTVLPVAQLVLGATGIDLPASYTVQQGDTISGIADRFGIPTPAILTLNGLSWNAVVHEGQVLKISPEPTKKRQASPPRVVGKGYLVQRGETASEIADRLGISTAALLEHNDLEPDAIIYAGQLIALPAVTTDVVDREASPVARILSTPSVVPASVSTEAATEETVSDDDNADSSPGFDAADIELAEKPVIMPVKAPVKVVTPEPKPVVTPPPVPTPAPAPAPAPSSPAQVEESDDDSSEEEAAESSVGQPIEGSITPLNDERRGNAQIIVNVGRELGVPDYGIVIALATAMQESSLRNIDWGDRDSVGLYQQRPSTGWGTVEQILDQAYATRLFFGGPSNPNKGRTRGLLDISGWESMALTVAAQRVQISAYPDAYAKWEASAWAWLYELS